MGDDAGIATVITTDEVLYDVVGRVATITLNAPGRMNTISGPMLSALSSALLAADADRDVRCLVITGAGRAFCAGLDLAAQMAGGDNQLGRLGNLGCNIRVATRSARLNPGSPSAASHRTSPADRPGCRSA